LLFLLLLRSTFITLLHLSGTPPNAVGEKKLILFIKPKALT
jgi:hypothetical protein